jgi:hypothetical protein
MDERVLARIDDFLTSIGATLTTVPSDNKKPRRHPADIKNDAQSIKWNTATVQTRPPATPTQNLLIDMMIEAQKTLDIDYFYQMRSFVCSAWGYRTNRTIEFLGKDYSVLDWETATWVTTVELSKNPAVASLDRIGPVHNFDTWVERSHEFKALVEQACDEWVEQGGDDWQPT